MFRKFYFACVIVSISIIFLLTLGACGVPVQESQIDHGVGADDIILLRDDLGDDFEAEDTEAIEDLLGGLLEDFTADFRGRFDIEFFSYGNPDRFENILGFTIEINTPSDWSIYDEKIDDFDGHFINQFLELAGVAENFTIDDFNPNIGDRSIAYTIKHNVVTATILTFRRDRFAYIIAHIFVGNPKINPNEIAETLDERLLGLFGEDNPQLYENGDLANTITTDLTSLFLRENEEKNNSEIATDETLSDKPVEEIESTPTPESPTEVPTEESNTNSNSIQRFEIPIDEYDIVIGPANAAITIIEFVDYECPYCQRYYTETYIRIIENYGDQIRYVVKDLPLTAIHPNAIPAAISTHCANEQDAFLEYRALLFSMDLGLNNQAYRSYAQSLSLDLTAFDACLTSGRYDQAVRADITILQQLNASISTPTFFINGLYVVGAQPFSVFSAIIDAELGASQNDGDVNGEPTQIPRGQVEICLVVGAGDLQSEHIVLCHVGRERVALVGWQLTDEDGHVFTFPAITLDRGGAISIYTKTGSSDDLHLYWGLSEAILSNGEIIYLVDPNGDVQAGFVVP